MGCSRLVNKWLQAQFSGGEWHAELNDITGRIYAELLAPIHLRLKTRYPSVKRLLVIPNQGLTLLPLHAAWWEAEDGGRRYLLDEYEIAFAPSALVMDRCLTREAANPRPEPSLFAVKNPDGSLAFADWEVEEIARLFPESRRRVLKGREASKAAVEAQLSFGAEKLFSTHGLFDFADPDKSYLKLHDGVLSLREILAKDLHGTWLAVMSACLTGLAVTFRIIWRRSVNIIWHVWPSSLTAASGQEAC